MDRGWQVGKSLPDRMWHLFEKQKCSDVTFVFPEERTNRIQAHKAVLIAGSPVFEAMLSGNFIESESGVEIVDITPGVLKEFLRYLYTDEALVDAENVLPLMYTATKYIVDGLNESCGSFLTNEINDENVCKILDDSIEYGFESITERCLKYILTSAGKVIKTQGFSSISQKALQLIVQSDELDINNETEVYDACIRWAKSHSSGRQSDQDLRNQLGPCMFQIRFHRMRVDEFASKMSQIDILTHKEKNLLHNYLVTKLDETKQKLRELNFNLGRRKTPSKLEISCYSPDSDLLKIIAYGNYDQTFNFSFKSGAKLWLRYICIYGAQGPSHTESITITLSKEIRDGVAFQDEYIEERNRELQQCWNQQGPITWTGNAEPTTVKIVGTRYLEPCNIYNISLTAATPDRDMLCPSCGSHAAHQQRHAPMICRQCGSQFQRKYHGHYVGNGIQEWGDIAFKLYGLNSSDPTRFEKLIVSLV